MDELKNIIKNLIRIGDCLNSAVEMVTNQGQSLDGFSALANFRSIASKASELAKTNPAIKQQDIIAKLIDIYQKADKNTLMGNESDNELRAYSALAKEAKVNADSSK